MGDDIRRRPVATEAWTGQLFGRKSRKSSRPCATRLVEPFNKGAFREEIDHGQVPPTLKRPNALGLVAWLCALLDHAVLRLQRQPLRARCGRLVGRLLGVRAQRVFNSPSQCRQTQTACSYCKRRAAFRCASCGRRAKLLSQTCSAPGANRASPCDWPHPEAWLRLSCVSLSYEPKTLGCLKLLRASSTCGPETQDHID